MRPSEPAFQSLLREDGRLRVAGRVPADLVHLEGHFPGHPIVPGFVQVDWALAQAVEHLGVTDSVAAFEALKFPTPLLPERSFELEVVREADSVRFRLETGRLEAPDRLFSSGRIRLDRELSSHEPEVLPDVRPDAAGISLRIPHAGPMRLLESVVGHDAAATTCRVHVGEDVPLLRANGDVSPCLAIELLAQAMASHGGLAQSEDAAPHRGFLIGAPRIALRTRRFRIGESLWVRADHGRGELGMVAFRCSLGSGAPPGDEAEARRRALAQGSLRAFIERET